MDYNPSHTPPSAHNNNNNPKKRNRDGFDQHASSFALQQAANLPGWRPIKPSQSPTPPRSFSPPSHHSTNSPVAAAAHASANAASSTSAFRNVSACNRCRARKNRCDQQLPACSACEKAGVKCVGFDPITKKQIPRSYIHHLESRQSYLESLLRTSGIEFVSEETFALDDKFEYKPDASSGPISKPDMSRTTSATSQASVQKDADIKKEQSREDEERLDKLVSSVGMVSVQGASDPRYLGSTSGISFARVVFTALHNTTASRRSSEFGGRRSSKAAVEDLTVGSTSMRDSFFGLHTRPAIKQAPFPDAELGLKLVDLYFEYANPQIPTLHRGEFMSLFNKVYSPGHRRTARECYLFNMVFAIGSGIIFGSSNCDDKDEDAHTHKPQSPLKSRRGSASAKRPRLSGQQHQPEEYHAAAIVHLEAFLSSAPATDHEVWVGGGLEELQAVLLLAGFALLRPVAPGLWYITGVAVRLAIDLGLHHEEEPELPDSETTSDPVKGRRQWLLDLRRRLFWCTYSFDRLVSISVGRPFGITDQVITTPFPSHLDDQFIATDGFKQPTPGAAPGYKLVSHHYFRLRLLQSEILQVLQYQSAQRSHHKAGHPNPFLDSRLPSPFLQKFSSFREWRMDADRRLWEWWQAAPSAQDHAVEFSNLFLELNYWQTVLMLFRTSLTAPTALAGEDAGVEKNVESPPRTMPEQNAADQEFVFLKIAEAGQRVLKIYRQLHLVHLVNYTFLATHHLFMAGISFLYAMWHSNEVRRHLSLDDVDFTVLAATSVLTDLMEKCPPAEACRDAFTRMSKATIKICMSSTGFGPQVTASVHGASSTGLERTASQQRKGKSSSNHFQVNGKQPPPKFDANLKELFTEDETNARPFGRLAPAPSKQQGPRRVPTPTPSPSAMPSSGPEMPSTLSTLNAVNEAVAPNVQPVQATNVFLQQPQAQQQRPTDYYSPANMDAATMQQQQQQQQQEMNERSMNEVGYMMNNPQNMYSASQYGGMGMEMDMSNMDVMNMAQEFNPSASVEYMAQDFMGGGNVGGYDLFDGFFFGQGSA